MPPPEDHTPPDTEALLRRVIEIVNNARTLPTVSYTHLTLPTN